MRTGATSSTSNCAERLPGSARLLCCTPWKQVFSRGIITSASTPPNRWRRSALISRLRRVSSSSNDERRRATKTNLAHALLSHFASEGIAVARQLLLGRAFDFEDVALCDELLETSTIMGERFPEYDEWLAAREVEKANRQKRMKELEGNPIGQLLDAFEVLAGKQPSAVPDAVHASRTIPRPATRSTLENTPRTGRNDAARVEAERSSRCVAAAGSGATKRR